MDESAQLATAGLAVTLAAVLLILSSLFLQAQPLERPSTGASMPPIKASQMTRYQPRGS